MRLPATRPRARRALRLLGTVLIAAGLLALVWAFVVWRWQDPFTALYTKWKQHELRSQYDRRVSTFAPPSPGDSLAATRRNVARAAERYRASSRRGQAIGRILIPRMGLHMILVNGTDHDTLTKGPGRDQRTYMPGENRLVYIAGHRTTYLAPFSHIDALRPGDRVTLRGPVRDVRLLGDGAPNREGDRSLGPEVAAARAARAAGVPPEVLRYASIHRVREARARRAARRDPLRTHLGSGEREVADMRSLGELTVPAR